MNQEKYNTNSKKEIQKIINENKLLSEQVKRLVKTEYALYNAQIEIDKQINIYRSLYDIGKRLSTSTQVEAVFAEFENFIIEQLNYGGYILLEKNSQTFSLIQNGGSSKNITLLPDSLSLDLLKKLLNSIKDDNGNYIFTENYNKNKLAKEIYKIFGFFEFAIFEFIIGRNKKPSYILIVGNPDQCEFYSRIVTNDIRMIGLGNLVSLIVNALNNIIHYQQLMDERKTLEKKVKERTHDLNNALRKLKIMNKKLSHQSLKDELTELYNRRGFAIIGDQCFRRAKRNGTNLMLIYCDMDKLKIINDLYGHKEGDFALKQLALIFKKVFRSSDIICRFGGDEFIILMENTSMNYIENLKERLKKSLYEYNSQSHKEYEISISYGYALFTTEHIKILTLNDLVEKADEKLYEEKIKKKKLENKM